MLSRSERFTLWRQHLPYRLRRLLQPLAGVGLGSWPGALLWAAGLIVLLGILWAVVIMPEPGWPPVWSDKNASERIQIAGALLSGVAVTGVVISLAAGVAELNKVFPKQRIHFAVNCVQGEHGPCSVVTIVNGNAFCQSPGSIDHPSPQSLDHPGSR